MPTLTILLDTNEYIFGLTKPEGDSAKLLENLPSFIVKLPRFILSEIHSNLPEDMNKIFYALLKEAKVEIVEEPIPASLVAKYKKQLPEEDAVIAAYCEFLQVDILISENRHFLVDFHPKAFKVLSAQNFLAQYPNF